MKINLSFEGLTPEQANAVLHSLNGNSPALETATLAEQTTEKATKPVAEKATEPVAEKESKYTIESIRKAAKDVAREKGQPFVKEALEAVGATSISKIGGDMFDDFMNLLIEKK